MSKVIDITGEVFGRLTVLNYDYRKPSEQHHWLCECSCENKTIRSISSGSLKSGKSQSCGCILREKTIKRNTKHGMSKTKIYLAWKSMINRCENPITNNYHNYGGRGIKVCERWHKFENFYEDMGERPKGKTLDRYPNKNGNYEPTNCRWATRKEQARNTRQNYNIIYKGKTQCISDWARELNINRRTLKSRFEAGWSIERSFETPVIK